MSESSGTIVEFNRDGLGWIDLDDGQRIRFGHSVCKGFTVQTLVVGARVRVAGTAPGFQGVLRATGVTPFAVVKRDTLHWADFVASHPRWSDVESVCIAPRLAELPIAREPPSLFAPWRDEIVATTPTAVMLHVPDYGHDDPIEPSPDDCFSHGRVAFLEEAIWPDCKHCNRPLEMCIQLSEAAMAPWAPGRGSLVVLFCFDCGVSRRNKDVAYVRFVRPNVRVVGPETSKTASSSPPRGTQRVRIGEPRRLTPAMSWYRYRSEITPTTASSAIFGYFEDVDLEGPMDDPEIESMEDVAWVFEEWQDSVPPEKAAPGESWGGAMLGGAPNWDQRDATPSCVHGGMRHLLEYEGGQFLDGAIHVFACPDWICTDLRYFAEF